MQILVGGEVTMGTRMYDIQHGKLAVLVSQGITEFSRVKIDTV
ncbi:hypothetical protein [Paenibacillus sp. FSL R10-2734]